MTRSTMIRLANMLLLNCSLSDLTGWFQMLLTVPTARLGSHPSNFRLHLSAPFSHRFCSPLLLHLCPLGMELFEEALQKWEQALNVRHSSHSSASNNTSLALQGAACAEPPTVPAASRTFTSRHHRFQCVSTRKDYHGH